MKRMLSILLACLMLVSMLAACGNTGTSGTTATPSASASASASAAPSGSSDPTPDADGMINGRFVETKKITVEVYDRGNDGGSPPENNVYTDYIKKGMLEKYNVEVEFIPVGRWTEVDDINNLLAGGIAPDVCVTYSYPTIQTYANMGGVLDLAPLVDKYKDLLPNMFALLGDENVYYDKDPDTGTLWALEARLIHNMRINTFVREDWLKKLNLKEPTSLQEFEDMLKAFKNNASTLLGADANKMIPFSISYDVGWRADNLNVSFMPDPMDEKTMYVNGFDDRHLLFPNYKEGIRVLNKWYNEGLIWKDFPLYGKGDTTEDNLLKAGYVGAFIHNWDYPYRNGPEGIHGNLQTLVGPEAAFIAVDPFKNENGKYAKFVGSTVDRKVFFPATNDEPLASLLYVDFISSPETIKYLQIGEEGINHEVQPDGAIKLIARSGGDPYIMNSGNNIDYTITANGLYLGDPDLTIKSMSLGYAGVDPRFIEKALQCAKAESRQTPTVHVGEIKAEEGMGAALSDKRDAFLIQSIVASPDKFDSVYDSGMADYLSSGGQAIIDERTAAYEKYFGK